MSNRVNRNGPPVQAQASPDWVQRQSAGRDRPYYFNTRTGESTWRKPYGVPIVPAARHIDKYTLPPSGRDAISRNRVTRSSSSLISLRSGDQSTSPLTPCSTSPPAAHSQTGRRISARISTRCNARSQVPHCGTDTSLARAGVKRTRSVCDDQDGIESNQRVDGGSDAPSKRVCQDPSAAKQTAGNNVSVHASESVSKCKRRKNRRNSKSKNKGGTGQVENTNAGEWNAVDSSGFVSYSSESQVTTSVANSEVTTRGERRCEENRHQKNKGMGVRNEGQMLACQKSSERLRMPAQGRQPSRLEWEVQAQRCPSVGDWSKGLARKCSRKLGLEKETICASSRPKHTIPTKFPEQQSEDFRNEPQSFDSVPQVEAKSCTNASHHTQVSQRELHLQTNLSCISLSQDVRNISQRRRKDTSRQSTTHSEITNSRTIAARRVGRNATETKIEPPIPNLQNVSRQTRNGTKTEIVTKCKISPPLPDHRNSPSDRNTTKSTAPDIKRNRVRVGKTCVPKQSSEQNKTPQHGSVQAAHRNIKSGFVHQKTAQNKNTQSQVHETSRSNQSQKSEKRVLSSKLQQPSTVADNDEKSKMPSGTDTDEVELMEVDETLGKKGKIFVVVDTNLLIHDLAFIRQIKGKTVEGVGKIVLVIPWMVVQELDSLKVQGTKDALTPLACSARKAADFLHKNKEDPAIKGQSYQDYKENTTDQFSETNDDQILQYCLQCKGRYQDSLVVLLSNDKNLSVKASFSGVSSYGNKNFFQELAKKANLHSDKDGQSCIVPESKPMPVPSNDQRSSWNASRVPINAVTPLKLCPDSVEPPTDHHHHELSAERHVPATNRSNAPRGVSDAALSGGTTIPQNSDGAAEDNVEDRRKAANDVMHKMKVSLQLAVSTMLRKEMEDSYTEHWLEIVHKKPPWTLLTALQCIKKHYKAVFGLILGRHTEEDIDLLLTFAQESPAVIATKKMKQFQYSAMVVLRKAAEHSTYNGIITHCQQDLQNLLNSWKQTEDMFLKTETASTTKEDSHAGRRASSESENMLISPVASTTDCTLRTSPDWQNETNNQQVRESTGTLGEVENTDEVNGVTFTVLSVFEAVWTKVQYYRDVIVSSIQHLAHGEPVDGFPTKEESLAHLSKVIPLLEAIIGNVHSLMCNIDDTSVHVFWCTAVVDALTSFIKTLEIELDVSGLQPEIFYHFVAVPANRDRLVVGTEQLASVLQQLMGCISTLLQ